MVGQHSGMCAGVRQGVDMGWVGKGVDKVGEKPGREVGVDVGEETSEVRVSLEEVGGKVSNKVGMDKWRTVLRAGIHKH